MNIGWLATTVLLLMIAGVLLMVGIYRNSRSAAGESRQTMLMTLTVEQAVSGSVPREVRAEMDRAHAKFGDQFDFTNGDWLAVLTEEVGEAATEVLKAKFHDPAGLLRRSNETGISIDATDDPVARLRAELIQVAAVAQRWIAALAERKPG